MGLLAALLMVRYMGSVEQKAQTDTQMEEVLVVAGAIAQGEQADGAIEAGKITIGKRPRADLPADRITRVDDIRGLSASIAMQPGEVVTESKFASSGALTNSNSFNLEEGMVALTISVDSSRSVAGLLRPGDFVNVLVQTANGRVGSDGGDAAQAGGAVASDAKGVSHLFQKVKVLAVGTDLGQPVAAIDPATGVAPATTAPIVSDLLTLELPAEASEIVALAADLDSIRLSLVRPDYQPRPLPGVVNGTFSLPGVAGLTPDALGVPAAEAKE